MQLLVVVVDSVPVLVDLVAVSLVLQPLAVAAVEPVAVVWLTLASVVLANVVYWQPNVVSLDAIELAAENVAKSNNYN